MFLAARTGGTWSGRIVSHEAITDQNAAAIAVTSELSMLIMRSSLRLYTRTYD